MNDAISPERFLPRDVIPAALAPSGIGGRAPAGSDGGPLRVLVIEDSPTQTMRLQQLLARSREGPFEVATAPDLTAALGSAAAPGADAVLLDLGLPDACGSDAYLRIAGALPRCPVLVLAGPDQRAAGLEAVRLGAQDWLVPAQASAASLGRAVRCAVERHRVVDTLRGLSLTDELTGLHNRRGFQALAGTHLRLGNRTGSCFLLLFADVDGLKEVNDTYGHPQGDLMLIRAAEVLRATFRQSDVVARFGGDEFAILALDGCGDGGRAMLRRLETNLARANATAGAPALELSLGGVTFDARDDRPLDLLLAEADRALYAEKRARVRS